MNLLGMKRKLLPYGMALGGGSALGAMSTVGNSVNAAGSASPSSSAGSKSAPVAQNTYGAPFNGGFAGSSGPSTGGGGKSSGLGQGGYGAAPAFGQQVDGIANNNANTAMPSGMTFGMGDRGGMGAGKSSGLGQGGYGMAPAFGGQQPQPFIGGETVGSTSGGMQPPVGSPDLQRWNAQQAMRQALDMPPPSSNLNKSFGSYGGMGNPFPDMPAPGTRMQSFDPYGRMGMGGGYGRMQQPMANPYQQQPTPESLYAANLGIQQPQFNPYQGPQMMGSYGQSQAISGLQSLFNQMMGQQRVNPFQQNMPQYGQFGGGNNPLGYRPDMSQAQAALSRVKPSVRKQQQDAQAARIKELEEQLAQYNTPAPSTNDYSGGG